MKHVSLLPVLLAWLIGLQTCLAAGPEIDSISNFGTTGKGSYVLAGGKEVELFYHQGKGCLTHMWFGGGWPGYEKTRIRIYVDGEAAASINMELGLGHGFGFGDQETPWGIARIGKTGNPSGIYNTYRIPFGKIVRVTAQLGEGMEEADPKFWWIIRGAENLPVTIAGIRLPAEARLKLHKLENYTAQAFEEFPLCNVNGAGALYEVTMAARCATTNNLHYMEGCMRAYFDGAKEPFLLSSGLEDYFLGTYYFNKGRYATPVAGLTHLDRRDASFSAYRFHDDDPIFFHTGFKLTCRCGDTDQGQPPLKTDPTIYTTYVWIYEW